MSELSTAESSLTAGVTALYCQSLIQKRDCTLTEGRSNYTTLPSDIPNTVLKQCLLIKVLKQTDLKQCLLIKGGKRAVRQNLRRVNF